MYSITIYLTEYSCRYIMYPQQSGEVEADELSQYELCVGLPVPGIYIVTAGLPLSQFQNYDLLANSLEYPQRIEIEWSQCLNSMFFVCLLVSKFVLFLYYKVL